MGYGTGKFMKKVLFAATLMVATTTAFANGADKGEGFLSIQAGRSHFGSNSILTPHQSGLYVGSLDEHFDRRDQAFGMSGGYRWPLSSSIKVGIEGGYVDLGEATARYDREPYFVGNHFVSTEKRREDVKAPFVGINGRWVVGSVWSLTARGGVARYRSSLDVDEVGTLNGGPPSSSHEGYNRTSLSYYFGAALGYDVTQKLTVAISFDQFNPQFAQGPNGQVSKDRARVKVTGLRAEYRFL
jgi:hypothetical protein